MVALLYLLGYKRNCIQLFVYLSGEMSAVYLFFQNIFSFLFTFLNLSAVYLYLKFHVSCLFTISKSNFQLKNVDVRPCSNARVCHYIRITRSWQDNGDDETAVYAATIFANHSFACN